MNEGLAAIGKSIQETLTKGDMKVADELIEDRVVDTIRRALAVDSALRLDRGTGLLGVIPELDSFGLVSVLTALEVEFDLRIEDDDVEAEVFRTVGTLVDFVATKVQRNGNRGCKPSF